MTVEIDVPENLYNSIRKSAEAKGVSVSEEVIETLKHGFPTEPPSRKDWYESAMRIRARASGLPGPSAEEMLREDRER